MNSFFLGLLLSATHILSPNISDKDTLQADIASIEHKLISDYDSLLMSFYIQNSIDEDTVTAVGDSLFFSDMTIDTDKEIYDLNDSIIIKQMSEMCVLFDVSYNNIVKSFIKVYTGKKRGLTETVLGLSEYYFPMFESELDAANMPLELKYLPVIESALNPRAVSRAGAAGLWQFMYATGRHMGLEINSLVDERRDVAASTKAAVKYLKQLYAIYDDWVLALAAYNCGPGNVNKAIRRSGGSKNYWEIYYKLPRETRNYVPGFIAVMYAFEYYRNYNLTPKKITIPQQTDTIMIYRQLHLEQVADVLSLPLEQLRDLNPQYRRDIIPAQTGKNYPLRLPFEYAAKYIDMEDSIYKYKDTVFFNPKVLAAAPVEQNKYSRIPPSKNHKTLYYKVTSGDNLGFIASWFDVRTSDLKEWNNLYRNTIRAGQKLLIYVPSSKYNYYKEFNNLDFASKQKRVGVTTPKKESNEATAKTDDPNAKYLYYTIKKGDTLWDIAKKFYDVTDSDLLNINGLSSGKSIKPGMQIKIKKVN